MGENTFLQTASDHSVMGASTIAIMVFGYKIYQILKRDRKEDDLDNAERSFRDEIRQEVKELRMMNNQLQKEKKDCEKLIADLTTRLGWLEVCFAHCKDNHPAECPLLKHLGQEGFDNLARQITH